MTKAKISEYNATAANNTDANGVNIAEGCAPSGINNAIREVMAALKRFQVGSDGDGVTVGGNLVVSGSATLANTATLGNVDINGGTIDGATIATSDITVGSGKTLNVSAGTLTLANDQISGDKVEGGTINATTINTLTSTTVNATTVDATNVEVTNVKAKDGTASVAIADSTGAVTVSTLLNVDNLRLDGNTISSTNSNGNIVLAPNGTGDVQVDADTLRVGDSNANATITTNGTGNLILNTNAGTNSGTITITQGSNANIVLAPNGTGDVQVDADTLRVGDSGSDATIQSNGNADLILKTGNATTGSVTLADGANGNLTVALNGTGQVIVNAGAVGTPTIAPTGDTNTGIFFPEADTIGFVCGGTEEFRVDSTGQLWNTVESQVGTDYTTLYKGYFCRAWVNFNGSGTVAIRASGNVSSITDNGTGDYTVNFTTALPDANYALNYQFSPQYGVQGPSGFNLYQNASNNAEVAPTTTAARFNTNGSVGYYDPSYVLVAIFR